MDLKNTYWNGDGKYQEQYDQLDKQVPAKGIAKEIHIELVRCLANCYHDHFNNGSGNWDSREKQFAIIEHYKDNLYATAQSEDIAIEALLCDIRVTLDDGHWPLDEEDGERMSQNWERLADIVFAWAWQVEQSIGLWRLFYDVTLAEK